jgi:hypothetical protein
MVGLVAGEAGTTVLPGDAGFLQYCAGAELPLDALDETDGAALVIDCTEQDQ